MFTRMVGPKYLVMIAMICIMVPMGASPRFHRDGKEGTHLGHRGEQHYGEQSALQLVHENNKFGLAWVSMLC